MGQRAQCAIIPTERKAADFKNSSKNEPDLRTSLDQARRPATSCIIGLGPGESASRILEAQVSGDAQSLPGTWSLPGELETLASFNGEIHRQCLEAKALTCNWTMKSWGKQVHCSAAELEDLPLHLKAVRKVDMEEKLRQVEALQAPGNEERAFSMRKILDALKAMADFLQSEGHEP